MVHSLKNIFSLFKGKGPKLVVCFLFAFLSITSKLAIPFLSGKAIDILRETFVFADLLPYLFAIFGLLLFGAVMRYFFDFLANGLVEEVLNGLRNDLYASYLDSSLTAIEKRKQGDLLSCLLGDMDTLQKGLVSGATAVYEGIVQILLTIVFMFLLSPILSAAVIVLTPISVLMSRFIAKKNANGFKRQNAMLGEVAAFALESLDNSSTIESYGLWKDKEEKFAERAKSLQKASFSAQFAASLINPCTRLVNNIIYATLVLLGVVILMFDTPFSVGFTVGALSSFLSYAYQYMAPFNEVADASSDVIFASVAADRIREAVSLDRESEEGEAFEGNLAEVRGENIVFGYDPSRPVLKGIDFDIKKGMKVALVGTTGCGKTTLLSLLMRFYDQNSGSFHFNESDLSSLSLHSSRAEEGVILQDAILLSGTVYENVAIGRIDASKQEIVQACIDAGADPFIRALKDGYDTKLNANSNLSEGQKQLLNLARVMLLDKELMLLDEATSHLDLLTEIKLQESFRKLTKGKTSIIVAHRLSTVVDSDMILVMDQGKIVESGTYAELIRKNGFFAELYRSQLS
ncbi:MAG: ABC transporter ATP-binding protein/permease [Bacilli bacterium]|nr:ABC transporter ATP-binding protein/permease [Bacilli bacterium]